MNKKQDIFGDIPEEGDLIVFNPPKYKGLVYGTCIGFTEAGLPKCNNLNKQDGFSMSWDVKTQGYYTPKTGFVIKKR